MITSCMSQQRLLWDPGTSENPPATLFQFENPDSTLNVYDYMNIITQNNSTLYKSLHQEL